MKHAAWLVIFFFTFCASSLPAASCYTLRPDDPKAVYLSHENFSFRGDGIADDTDAIQNAIDKVQETTVQGIVFIPEGRYRISKSIIVWPGIRLIGYGQSRPVFVLGKSTPGFQEGIGYMVVFAGGRPSDRGANVPSGRRRPGLSQGIVPPNTTIPDANPGTFYSAMSNIDFEIQDGNPAAIGIRFHVAQHCYLAHMDFRIGSAMAALHDIGNEAEDLHFYGGQYGIMTRKPSPGWQFTLLDSRFEGQSRAAIKEHEAGLTIVRTHIKNVPAAISIDPGYADELWVKDSRFEDISGPAITISNENNARTEINLENIVCRHVPVFAAFRESGKKVAGVGDIYRVRAFTHGLTFNSETAPAVRTTYETTALAALPNLVPSDVPALPPQSTWVNLQSLGAKGDGATDDTAIIKKAIAEHQTIYIPSGHYIVTDTITLRPDTVLIGLSPTTTQFDIPDSTPAFQGPGSPKPLLEAPRGGKNIVTGIGLYTNGINSRAVGAKWMAGSNSLMDDVRFLGGHGTNYPGVSFATIYNNTHTADTDINRHWDSQYPSLWITDGGGGTFANIWTPSTFAQAGLYISNTSTEGRIYELSSEHHVRNEVKIKGVSNWQIYALQTEEERGEGPFCLPLSIDDSTNITLANYHGYRVVSSYQPFITAIKISNSNNIRLRNIHVYGDNKVSFDNAVIINSSPPTLVRNREFASLTVKSSATIQPYPQPTSSVLASGAKVEKVRDGFYNISGAAVDKEGRLYFVDPRWQRIYRWSPEPHQVDIIRDSPFAPVQLAFDRSGNLLVVSYDGNGTVYSFSPDSPGDEITLLKPQPSAPRPSATAVLPVNHWRNENDFVQSVAEKKSYQYVATDGSTFIPAGEDFVTGALYYGTKMADILRAFGLAPAIPGKPFYVSNESEQKTYVFSVGPDGTLAEPHLFVDQGGESVAQDIDGNVYIAAGQIYVYNPAGKLIDTIDVPDRPIDLIFGGKAGNTLFILARGSLYAVQTRAKGLGLQK